MSTTRTLSRLLKYVRAHRGAGAKSSFRQYYEMIYCAARYQLTPREYHLYQLWRSDKSLHEASRYLSNQFLVKHFRPKLNDQSWSQVLDNKLVFVKWYGAHVRVPPTLGFYHPVFGFRFSASGQTLSFGSKDDLVALLRETRPANGLVVKPVGGIQGKGVLVLTEIVYKDDSPALFTTTDGRLMDLRELSDLLERPHGVRSLQGYLVQERVKQHGFFERLNPFTPNTIRVVTYRSDNEITVQYAVLRLGRKGNRVDNWDAGGISVNINVHTGVLGKGLSKPEHGGVWYSHHPDSGVQFEGLVIPMWEEVVSICKRAAELTPFVRSIGWDVIVSPTGPVLIEGNPSWDLNMVQVHSDGYLSSEFREELRKYGLRLPE